MFDPDIAQGRDADIQVETITLPFRSQHTDDNAGQHKQNAQYTVGQEHHLLLLLSHNTNNISHKNINVNRFCFIKISLRFFEYKRKKLARNARGQNKYQEADRQFVISCLGWEIYL